MNVLLACLISLFSGIALSQEASTADTSPSSAETVMGAEELALPMAKIEQCIVGDLGDLSNLPGVAIKFLPFFLGLLIMLRGLSAGLLRISERTVNKTDDKVAQAITTVASFMARLLSIAASMSMPNALLMAKAEKIALKESGNGNKSEPPANGGVG